MIEWVHCLDLIDSIVKNTLIPIWSFDALDNNQSSITFVHCKWGLSTTTFTKNCEDQEIIWSFSETISLQKLSK